MGGKFGDDPGTLKVISSILQGYIKDGRKLKPDDIDQMETDIFQRLSNVSKNIALDQFHPRLVVNAHKEKSSKLDPNQNMRIESGENSFDLSIQSPQKQPQVRAQTSNGQGFRKYAKFFKSNASTAQASIETLEKQDLFS